MSEFSSSYGNSDASSGVIGLGDEGGVIGFGDAIRTKMGREENFKSWLNPDNSFAVLVNVDPPFQTNIFTIPVLLLKEHGI